MSTLLTLEQLHVTFHSYEVVDIENQKYSSADVKNSATGVVVGVEHHNITKFFLKDLDTGEERYLELSGNCISARPGHKITLAYNKIEEAYVEQINHNTQQRISAPLSGEPSTTKTAIIDTIGFCVPGLSQYLGILLSSNCGRLGKYFGVERTPQNTVTLIMVLWLILQVYLIKISVGDDYYSPFYQNLLTVVTLGLVIFTFRKVKKINQSLWDLVSSYRLSLEISLQTWSLTRSLPFDVKRQSKE